MPIDAVCDECGKNLRVRDAMAGKRVRCPGCSAAVTVPTPLEEVENEPEETSPLARRSKVRTADDKPRRTPVSSDDDDDDDEQRPKARSRRREEEDDDDEDERPRPARKKSKSRKSESSSLPLILGIVAAAVVLLGVAGASVWWLLPGSGGAQLTAYVPGDGEIFISMRSADLWRVPGFKDGFVRGARMQPGAPDPINALQQNVGLMPEEVERVSMIIQGTAGDATWFVIETIANIDQARIKSKFQNPSDGTHLNKKYTAGTMQGVVGRMAVHFAGPRMMVIAPEGGIRLALDVAVKRNAGPLDAAVALLGNNKQIVAGFNLQPGLGNTLKQMVRNPSAAPYAALAEMQSGTITMNINRDLDAEATFQFAGDAQAQAGKSAIEKAVPALRGLITVAKFQAQPAQQKELAALEKGIDTIKAEQRGPRLVVTFKAEGALAP